MRIEEDGFIVVSADAQVEDVIQALDQVKSDGYPRPRFAVVQKPEGAIAGIVLTSTLDWAEPDELVSDQADLDTKRHQVALDATDTEKAAAVNASEGLALGMQHGRLVAILRPAELGMDGRLYLDGTGPAPPPGVVRCPNCGLEISHYLSLPRLGPNRQVLYQRLCPYCNYVISER
jgi:hypothetical protein